MSLENGEGYKMSPENHAPNSFDALEYLHKIYFVKKFHEIFGLEGHR
jgi:hypothetical protein